MRAPYSLLLLALATAPVLAQNVRPVSTQGTPVNSDSLQNPEQLSGRSNQRTERIRIEDAGSRVDELRVGGQTQTISVQPKAGNLPSYEVQSPDGARSRVGNQSGAEAAIAPRVWNVLKF